jgi:23S rRNA pseudouridine1911/1915/1917 synthase
MEIIFENNEFIIVNKPPGELSIPDRTQSAPSLKEALQAKYGSIFTVHRLDRGTSGLILFAKNELSHQYFSKEFEGRNVLKNYLGIIKGAPVNPVGTVETGIMEHPAKNGKMVVNAKGKNSITDYELQENFGTYSLLSFRIHTGRTHQIRVHMQYLGHPIVCDELYGDGEPVFLSSIKKRFKLSKAEEEERPILHRLGLHASNLSFTDSEGIRHAFETPVPKDMKALLQQLRKTKQR